MLGVTLAERDIGVFVGVMTHDFSDQLCVQQVRVKPVLFGLCVCVNMGLYQPNGSKCNLSREHDDQSVDLPTVFNQPMFDCPAARSRRITSLQCSLFVFLNFLTYDTLFC